MSIFGPKCNPATLKSNLKLCISRLELLKKKKTEMGLKTRREIAELMKQDKIDRSRIKTEQIVREDYVVEAMEILQTYCELLISRFGIFESKAEVDPSLEPAISTILWCVPRLRAEVTELSAISKLFSLKYTKPFVESCVENRLKKVDPSVMNKLSLNAPAPELVEMYMIEIANSYEVKYEPNLDLLNKGNSSAVNDDGLIILDNIPPCGPVELPEGHNEVPLRWSHGLDSGSLPYPTSSPFPSADPPPPMPSEPPVSSGHASNFGTDNVVSPPSYLDSIAQEKQDLQPSIDLPGVPGGQTDDSTSGSAKNGDDEFDDLSKRFNQLLNKDNGTNRR